MEFFHQVKLLLWKNYLLRKRSRVFTIVELLWPLMLFLILTWVRTKELKKEWPECHFEPKSMPSTGLFEFFRSAICSFNNTCHRDEFVQRSFREELIRQEAEDNFSADQKFTQVLNDFEKVQNFLMHSIDPTFLERTLRLMNYTAQVNDSAQIPDLSVLMESSWDAWLFGFPKGYEKLMNFLKKAIVPGGASENDLRWYTNSAIEVLRGLRGLQVSEPTKNLLSRLRAVDFNDPAKGDTVTQVFPGLGNETWKLIDIFWPLGCGAEFNYAGQAIQRAQKNSFDEIVNRWQFEVEENYTSDPDFSPFCNRLFHKMQSTKGVTFFWKQMKPFIAGKLLYTPSVDWTDRIMTRVNSFWGGLKEFFNLVKFLRDVLPLLDAKSLSESSFFATLRSEQGRRNFRTLIGGFSAGDNVVEGLKRLLDWVDSPEASEAHARVSSGLETFLDYSECFRFDKIQPVENEAELVALGQNLTADNKLWAGLVFYPDVDADNATNATEDNLDLASCVIPSKADHLLGNSLSKNSLGYQNNESRCADNSTMPKFVVYKIRMDGGKVDDVSGLRDRIKNQGPRFRPALDLKFITFGFAYLQDLVEQAIVQEQTLNVGGVIGDWTPPPLPGLTMQQFPYPCYIEDRFIIAIERTFPMFMVLSWVFSAAMVIRSVVYEKELRLKETMRVMGLSRGTHWVAWTISSLCVMSVSAVLLAGLLVIGRTLDNTSFAVVLLFLFSYSVATLMLSFLLSCFFSRANLAAAAGGILFFVTYLPYPFMIVWDHSVLDWQRFIGSALSNVAFGFGCDVLAEWEELGVGAHWHNLFQSPDPFNTELSLGSQILALWVDAMLYFLAAVYIEGVFPGRYGVPLPWWYPFSLSYWSGDFVGKDNKFDAEPASPGNRKVNESDPVGLTKGVEMINLRKVYDDYDKIAVDNLNLSFYENQITAFLGHNGAGKTTTISILTGLLQPTAGTAKIYGQDIRTEMDSIRKSMGVCPQHNVLFHYMTVEEHLLFYAGLKGTLSDQEMDREVQDMIRDLGLPKKRHELSCNLSGGMQRKLSIAISFLAKSRTVFLDEPTAGVDPHSRRAIWKLLTKYKKGRTVILTTHHMDEAEILGDRIAIISCGALVCSGSALFLKKLYGSGYVLRVVLSENLGKNDEDVANDGETEKAAKKRIQHFLRQLYRGIRVAEEVGSEISFLLPWSKNSEEVVNAVGDSHESHENVRESHVKDVMRLQKLLEALDKRIDELPISSYGISDTKLEEIFLRVTSDADVGAPKKKRKSLLQLLLETYARGKTEIMTTLQSSPSIISATLPGNRRGSDASSVTPCCTPAYGDCVNRLLASARRRRNVVNTAEEPAKNSAAIDIPNVAREGNGEAKNEMNEEDGDGIEDEEDPSAPLSPKKISQPRIVRMTQDKQYKNLDGGKLLVTQFLAVEAKRYHHAKRDSRTLFCQLVLPVLFVTLAMMSTSIAPGIDVEDEYNYRELHHWHYHSSPVVFFSESDAWRASRAAAAANRTLEEQQARINVIDDDEAWFNEDLFGDEQQDVGNGVGRRGEKRFEDIFDILGADGTTGGAVTDPYLRSMLSPTGIGTRCVHEHYYFPCLRSIEYNVTDLAEPLNGTFPLGDCSCTNGGQYCPADASKPEPIGIQMPTSDFVVNITDRNPSQWIINTHQAMKLIRYGGYTFGMKAPGPFSDSPPWNVSSVGLLLAGAARAFNVTLGDELATRSLLLDKTLNHDEPDRVRGYNDTTRPYIKVWFFNKGWITSVAFMNAINNVILRTHLEAKFRMMNSSEDAILPDFREYGVAVVNHPISTDNAFQATIIKRSAFALLHSICVIYAMSFVPAAFVVYLIEDRISGSKHLQFVSGLPPWLYWISAYAWDMSSYLVSASLCVFVFLVFDEEAYVARDTFPGLLVLMVLYGWATVPLMYPFSFFFETSSFAFVALATANLFIGIVSTISTFVLEIMEEEEFQDIANVLKQVFLAFPQYCLGRGLMELAKFKVISSSVAMILDTEVKELDVFEWTFLGRNVASMIAQGFLGFAVTLLIQYRPKCGWWSLIRFNSCCVCFRIGNSMKIMLFRILRAASPTAFDKWRLDNELRVVSTRSEAGGKTESEDEDVARERREVLDGSGEATLKVVNLTKVYGKTDLTAVNGTCFAVRRGECFGLLGVNGAGKTTTFKMLTGDVSITSGDAFVDGFSVRNKLNKVRRRLGYCPQFDALDPLLTSREHLYLYARLRGLPSQQMESTVDSLLERMNLGYYADRKSETYSGGNKRKLSTAIALVGNPSLVFLDEPTSGMDAGARRFLWNCILDLAHKDKRCVILTSHSMEECETLCSRLAIMVSGSFRCIGSVQHLKNKFGSGYTLSMHAAPWDLEKAAKFVADELAAAGGSGHLQERNPTRVVYHLPHPGQGGVPLSAAFRIMERGREQAGVLHYSISQTTLDEVFVRFAMESRHMEDDVGPQEGAALGELSGPTESYVRNSDDPLPRASASEMELGDLRNGCGLSPVVAERESVV